MSTPLMTDEDLFEDKKEVKSVSLQDEVKEMVKEKPVNTVEDSVDIKPLNKEIIEETEKEIKEDIPSNYIEINLVSNGRIKDTPTKLHFRCYSASDALDLNVDDDEKTKAIVKVLTRLNYEHFDIGELTIQDVLFILYKLHCTFVSPKITRKVYIDDTIKDDELLNADDNIEEVDIPATSMVYAYLGKDYDDNDLPQKIKVPFTIKDTVTNDSASFRFTTLNDIIRAEKYCNNYYKEKWIKFGEIRNTLNRIENIKNEGRRDEELDKYLIENEEYATEYYHFRNEYSNMIAKIIEASSIVSFNGKEITELDEKWDIYNNKLPISVWDNYIKVVNDYPFGLKDDIDVFVPSLNKVVHRRVGFQFDDYIHINNSQIINRCIVEFD